MPDVSAHAPGAFSWVELATTDQKGAAAFYRELFGWQADEQPIGPTETYSMYKLRGLDAAAGYTQRDDERKMGIPPHWGLYVTVEDAEAAQARAVSLGATVLAPVFDVMEHGRMAVVQDPAGAVFQLWLPTQHIGVRVLNEPGALCWTELQTRDTAAAERFYTQLFGWSAKTGGADSAMPYTEFTVKGAAAPSIGMLAIQPEWGGMPPNWLPYFMVADCDASVARVRALGGRVYVEPTDVGEVGRFAVVTDPQGAAFAVFRAANA
jgi:predicted enzyme related to lactoylglutathione lyase